MTYFRRGTAARFRQRGIAGEAVVFAGCERLEPRYLLTGLPLGGETLVAPSDQAAQFAQSATKFTDQAVAVHADASFAVAFTSHGEAAKGDEVYVRRFDAERHPTAVNDLIRVSADGAGDQLNAAVTTLPDGGLLVAWYDRGCSIGLDDLCTGPFDAGDAIYARRFDRDGNAIDAEPLLVNADQSGAEASPAVSALPDGGFAVAWAGRGADGQGGVWLRQFDASGVALDADDPRLFTGGSYTESPSFEVDAAGNLAIVWSVVDGLSPGQRSEVLGRYYSADGGEPVGLSFEDGTSLERKWPSLDMDAAGNFVVAYTQAETTDSPATAHDVFVRRFSAGGGMIDEQPIRVTSTAAGDQRLGRVASAGDGSFLVAWSGAGESGGEGDNQGIHAQEFDSLGAPVGAAFAINSTFAEIQDYPSVEMSPTGDAVVVWSGYGDQVDATPESGDQSDPAGVFFQAIDFLAPVGELDVRGADGSILDDDDTPSLAAGTDFGRAVVGEGRVDRQFVIHNVGFGRLRFEGDPSVTVVGGEDGEFSVSPLDIDHLDPGGSVAFVVSFVPAAVGQRGATVTIHTDDADEGQFQFAVVGVGLTPVHPWRNPDDPFDVNGDGNVNGLDALIIINRLNKQGPHVLPPPTDGKAPPPFYDVSGDNKLTALDALQTINAINARRQTAAAQPASVSGTMTIPSAAQPERSRRRALASSSLRATAASTDAVFTSWSESPSDAPWARKPGRPRSLTA